MKLELFNIYRFYLFFKQFLAYIKMLPPAQIYYHDYFYYHYFLPPLPSDFYPQLKVQEENDLKLPQIKQEEVNQSQIDITREDLLKNPQSNFKLVWTAAEDQKLVQLVEKRGLRWKQIPKYMDHRNYKMCHSRYRRILTSKKQAWTALEDESIKKLVLEYGHKWKMINYQLPERTPKQIRERYVNFLRPNLNKLKWTLDEDLKLISLVNKYGTKWYKIEKEMNTRSHNQIKNRYINRILKVLISKREQSK